jgi:hypothetical protein
MSRLADWFCAPFRFVAWIGRLLWVYLFKDGIDE